MIIPHPYKIIVDHKQPILLLFKFPEWDRNTDHRRMWGSHSGGTHTAYIYSQYIHTNSKASHTHTHTNNHISIAFSRSVYF